MKDANLASEFNLATPEEVAKLRGGMRLGSLANERARGKGPPYVKLGACVMYPRDGLKKWIAQNTVTPGRTRTMIDGGSRRNRA